MTITEATSKSKDGTIVLNLTSFWIFIEGGLGGVMHLLHIPLTGFLIGGFSVITNILIAYFSNERKQFFKALSIVLLAKLLISPYSPPGAYVAVFFQGIMASVIFPILKLNFFSVFLYSSLVMLESAIQKPLLAYLIFGKELGQGIVIFVDDFFQNKQTSHFILKILVIIYFVIYILWSFLIGFWALRFISNYPKFKTKYSAIVKITSQEKDSGKKIRKPSKKKELLIIFFLLLGISSIAVLANEQSVMLYFIKTILILILFYNVIPKLFRLIQKKNQFKKHQVIGDAEMLFPMMYQNSWRANLVSRQYKGLKRIEVFIHLVIWLNVFYNGEEE